MNAAFDVVFITFEVCLIQCRVSSTGR